MKILTVAYPFAPVAADSVGGAEQIAFQLAEALYRRGHQSLLLARADSKFSGTLLPIPKTSGSLNEAAVREPIYRIIREHLANSDADLIHFHGVDFYEYLPSFDSRPHLVTLHLPIPFYPQAVLALRKNLYFNCVSEAQFGSCPRRIEATVIPNGVTAPSFAIQPKKRNFALSMGRICPEKGFHIAINAAAQARSPFMLAGEVFPYEAHDRYFREQIVPRLGINCRFIGRIGGVRKYRLLASAKCLLAPSLVHETSSLVAMEAMACGTPVIAFAHGALAALVQDGCTGFLVENEKEMACAIWEAGL